MSPAEPTAVGRIDDGQQEKREWMVELEIVPSQEVEADRGGKRKEGTPDT